MEIDFDLHHQNCHYDGFLDFKNLARLQKIGFDENYAISYLQSIINKYMLSTVESFIRYKCVL